MEKRTEPTVMFHTLGCKLNFAESAHLEELFLSQGIKPVESGEIPDYLVVNTCSVTGEADKKCRQEIRRLHRLFPKAQIIVTGCYSQLSPEEAMNLEGVVLVAGNDRKEHIIEYLHNSLGCHVVGHTEMRDFTPICAHGERTRYFLKVQEGCDYFCTYCTIPLARGRSRSASVAQTVSVARQAISKGAQEIVLTGVNTGDFGKGTSESFLDLCQALDQLENVQRFRISSIEPNLLTWDLIRFVADSVHFMPHFHIPLQSGDDEVLSLMHRRYDTALFRDKIMAIKNLIPEAFIGVDIMAGAMGETAQRFENSYNFAASLPVSKYHVFPYSERPGTQALNIQPKVPLAERHQRARKLIELSDKKLHEFYSGFIGQTRKVLVEQRQAGFTDNYIRVHLTSPASINSIINARLEGFTPSGDISASLC